MASDLNTIFLIGRLTQDTQIRQTPSGSHVCSFNIAVNRTYRVNEEKREEVSYFNCVAWGALSGILQRYAHKGKQVGIEGRLRQKRWQDQQSGQNRSTVEIVVENLQLLGGKESGGYDHPVPMDDSILDDDIPF